ncbi:tyrosine-type recombinase/integrase [Arcticibacter eurypsychrophilus]|uniref:tyrosine-type recombinase/integrase n=1 Tax=Arcticibacter eurypsychrophilus TaxID=1434752 RepID=UPI00084D75B3|nr:tyrosine-type recombinase/integrase [Arcticibacter eurypsychrophilus]
MAKPKFYLEPRPSTDGVQAINMFYSFQGRRLQYYTGVRIEIKHFRPECNSSNTIQPIKNIAPFAESYNKRLKEMASAAVTIVSDTKGEDLTVPYVREQLDLIYKPQPPEPAPAPEFRHTFISYFEQLIEDSKTGKRLIKKRGKSFGKRFTRNSIKNYGVTLSAIKRYLEYADIRTLPFEGVNKDFYEDFMFFCYDIEQKEISTFAGFIKDIKTVMMESKEPGFIADDFIMPSYESDTIYLNSNEIDRIANLDLSSYARFVTHQVVARDKAGKNILNTKGDKTYKPEKVTYKVLDKCRDLFLIGAYTGLRFGNFSNLDTQSVSGNFIKVKQIKTGARVTIPIMEKLKPVLAKYPTELPTLSNQKFNAYIKLVSELAGLTDIRIIKNYKGNIESETSQPLYSLVTSHCCRRSYATNMFNKGVSPMLIMSATGHKSESNFLKYIRTTDEQKANLLAETFVKLGL